MEHMLPSARHLDRLIPSHHIPSYHLVIPQVTRASDSSTPATFSAASSAAFSAASCFHAAAAIGDVFGGATGAFLVGAAVQTEVLKW